MRIKLLWFVACRQRDDSTEPDLFERQLHASSAFTLGQRWSSHWQQSGRSVDVTNHYVIRSV